MTNAEKYQEVFGFPPDKNNCPTINCESCPANNKEPICVCKWWDEEYKGNDTVKVEITEHHTFAKPDDVEDLDFPGVSSEDK